MRVERQDHFITATHNMEHWLKADFVLLFRVTAYSYINLFVAGFRPRPVRRVPRLQPDDVLRVGGCGGGGAGHARHRPRPHRRLTQPQPGLRHGAGPPAPLQRLLPPRLHAAGPTGGPTYTYIFLGTVQVLRTSSTVILKCFKLYDVIL